MASKGVLEKNENGYNGYIIRILKKSYSQFSFTLTLLRGTHSDLVNMTPVPDLTLEKMGRILLWIVNRLCLS